MPDPVGELAAREAHGDPGGDVQRSKEHRHRAGELLAVAGLRDREEMQDVVRAVAGLHARRVGEGAQIGLDRLDLVEDRGLAANQALGDGGDLARQVGGELLVERSVLGERRIVALQLRRRRVGQLGRDRVGEPGMRAVRVEEHPGVRVVAEPLAGEVQDHRLVRRRELELIELLEREGLADLRRVRRGGRRELVDRLLGERPPVRQLRVRGRPRPAVEDVVDREPPVRRRGERRGFALRVHLARLDREDLLRGVVQQSRPDVHDRVDRDPRVARPLDVHEPGREEPGQDPRHDQGDAEARQGEASRAASGRPGPQERGALAAPHGERPPLGDAPQPVGEEHRERRREEREHVQPAGAVAHHQAREREERAWRGDREERASRAHGQRVGGERRGPHTGDPREHERRQRKRGRRLDVGGSSDRREGDPHRLQCCEGGEPEARGLREDDQPHDDQEAGGRHEGREQDVAPLHQPGEQHRDRRGERELQGRPASLQDAAERHGGRDLQREERR